ncbi:MAG: hypothetical protein JWL94_1426 [Microbacteriaceae bacterium]|jgi:hypothetical protein|nr:hypothetical protein [Microbacteriaceae bacterium]HEV7956925.1 hypothetical protein [Marisediminicola sp.]
MSTFDTAGDLSAGGPYTDGLDSEAVTSRSAADDAATSGGTPEETASDGQNLGENGGNANLADGALSPGSTATGGPTTTGDVQ